MIALLELTQSCIIHNRVLVDYMYKIMFTLNVAPCAV